MHLIRFSLLLAAAPVVALAVTVHYTDPFGTAATSCASPPCGASGGLFFFSLDHYSLTVRPTLNGQYSILPDFDPNATSGPLGSQGIQIDPADVLFTFQGTVRYAIRFSGSGGPDPDELYDLIGSQSLLAAFQVLQFVGSTGLLSSATAGTVPGSDTITFDFLAPSGFLADLQGGTFGVEFPFVVGTAPIAQLPLADPPTPEPAGLGLTLIGLAIVARYRAQFAAPTIRRVLRS